ncbi:hypothetical protein V3W47_02400 [Deinococcus sp. YIM 134068]|uniref:hypothetical protein n=1 Tax=Deinococcus lichenicola TaxID=3118910 RepID=UPI002F920033
MSDRSSPPGHPAEEHDHAPRAVPRGTLMVVATLLLAIVFMWMLVLGVLEGRA